MLIRGEGGWWHVLEQSGIPRAVGLSPASVWLVLEQQRTTGLRITGSPSEGMWFVHGPSDVVLTSAPTEEEAYAAAIKLRHVYNAGGHDG